MDWRNSREEEKPAHPKGHLPLLQEPSEGHLPKEHEGVLTATAVLNTESSLRGAAAPHCGQSGAGSPVRRCRCENVVLQLRQRYS